ncbi:hypothetical protein V8G54_002086 [Vigna mungo]|uniref:F-box protein n=1 Tax=Vigna mungo TaxID=3915 RepID=A0AAQ3PAN6_VIGMU
MIYHFIDNLGEWCSDFDCKVYKEGVWKERERFSTGGRNLRFDMSVHHKGVIYVISDCSPYLTKTSLWRKILKIRVRAMELSENDLSQVAVKSFIVLNGELLVFAMQNKVYVYSLSDKRIRKVWNHESEFNILRFIPYKDTLCSSDIGTKILSLPIHV